jgi:sigma-B regulation protein RsbU (phosphoserine phosphatase)
LKGNFFVHIKDYKKPGIAERKIKDMSEGNKSRLETNEIILFNRLKNYLFFRPLEGTDWVLAQTIPVYTLDMFGIAVGLVMTLIIAFILIVTFFVCQLTIRHMAKPLNLLANTVDEVGKGQIEAALPEIDSHDEIHQLRDSFENMQHSLSNYIEELKETTSAKASMESELKIAHDIQMSMLPKTYPAFPDRHDIDIYGQVMPAKAVGGDLYDFFIREEKLFFCIGDVSGKGVPASLVMAVTRSLFRNISAYTQAPDQIVLALNDALSSNNETGMFVTLFLGVLDLASGHLSYANAAHNPPLVLSDGNVIDLDCDSNIPAGVMSGWQYTVQHLDMKAGDCVFLYTDGLNEAEDISHNQFGMENVKRVLSTTINCPQTLIEAMTSSVKMFVGNAEQSDDLTMLAIKYTLQ